MTFIVPERRRVRNPPSETGDARLEYQVDFQFGLSWGLNDRFSDLER